MRARKTYSAEYLCKRASIQGGFLDNLMFCWKVLLKFKELPTKYERICEKDFLSFQNGSHVVKSPIICAKPLITLTVNDYKCKWITIFPQ